MFVSVPHTLRLELVGPGGRRGSMEMPAEESGPMTVGRGPENHLQIVSPFISRRHGEFTRHNEGMRYRDLQSTSGSYFRGRRVRDCVLAPGERLHLGSPDGDCLTLLQGMPSDATSHSAFDTDDDASGVLTGVRQVQEFTPLDSDDDASGALTEVRQVQEFTQSQYLTQELPSERITGGRRSGSTLESRLRALIALTSDLLEVEDSDEMARRLLQQVMDILPVERGMVLLGRPGNLVPRVWVARAGSSSDSVESGFLSTSGGPALDIRSAKDGGAPPFEPIGTVVARVVSEGVGLLTLNASGDARLEGSESVIISGVRSILAAPVATSEQVYGVLYLDASRALRSGDEDALDWLVAAARQAGMVAQKLDLLAQHREMFESMMKGLAASIDARDGLTAGHSARVAHHSRETARFLGMSDHEQEVVHWAGLVHDYGKIGVDDAVLKKPARLSAEEYAHVQTHAQQTYDILKKIAFPKDLGDLPLMAASHHERMDGDGYPWRLAGEDIPIAGRIIAIADVYDSLTRKRHYRDPMPMREVLDHLKEGRGPRFDPKVLDAFFAYHDEILGPQEERRRLKRARTTKSPQAVATPDTDEPAEVDTIRR